MRILFAIQNVGGIDFNRDIGATIPVKYTLKGLQNRGHTVVCLKLRGNSVELIDNVNKMESTASASLGVSGSMPFRLIEGGLRRIQRMVKAPYYAFFDTFRFFEACSLMLPDFDLCHEYNGLFCAGTSLASMRKKKPYILTFDADPILELEVVGKPLRGFHAAVAKKVAKFTYDRADRIICVSEPAKQQLVEVWRVDPEKISILPNGVDIHFFGANHDPSIPRSQFGLNDSPIVSFVGSFQLWHGLEMLVESFAYVLSEIPQAKLLLIGDGPARQIVENKISELGISQSVIIIGVVPHAEIPLLLSAVDVAIIPYPRLPQELWFSPLKLYEYMAAGKAIVASNYGQIADVIQDSENGLLIKPGDVNGFAGAIIRLLKDPSEREGLGQNARRRAIEKHSWEQYLIKIEAIYQDVLDRHAFLKKRQEH